MEKIEKEPEGSEYLNIVGEGKYENVGENIGYRSPHFQQ